MHIAYVRNGAARAGTSGLFGPCRRADLRPRPHDLGSLHLALNVTDMDAILERALAWPLVPVGKEVRIDAGPNEGARIIYLSTPEEGLIIELIQLPVTA